MSNARIRKKKAKKLFAGLDGSHRLLKDPVKVEVVMPKGYTTMEIEGVSATGEVVTESVLWPLDEPTQEEAPNEG
jgi:hypothetical protein